MPTDMKVRTQRSFHTSVAVAWDEPTAMDNVDGALIPVQTEGPPVGAEFPLGTTTLGYTVTDAQGTVLRILSQ